MVVLRRHRDENALSLLRIRDVPAISEFSRTWYLEPDAARNLDSPQPGPGCSSSASGTSMKSTAVGRRTATLSRASGTSSANSANSTSRHS